MELFSAKNKTMLFASQDAISQCYSLPLLISFVCMIEKIPALFEEFQSIE